MRCIAPVFFERNLEIVSKETIRCQRIETVRETLLESATRLYRSQFDEKHPPVRILIKMRVCCYALMNVFSECSEQSFLSGNKTMSKAYYV